MEVTAHASPAAPSAGSANSAGGPRPADGRPRIDGKFIDVGGRRLWLRGVTYGTFAPGQAGDGFGGRTAVERDFDAMARAGVNVVRTYVAPPRWLLDLAYERDLWVLVGLPWEQHVAFLDSQARAAAIVDRVRAGVSACAGHPAILGFAIGNEIPASIVRWHGRRKVERFLRRLHDVVKAHDPDALVTYVNFPSTEYLRLPFLDFVAFNVYLEEQTAFEAYLTRLHNDAGERPLVMAEIGLDSRRHGLARQADVVASQVTSSFRAGCAGAFVFSWTDEWHRGGGDVLDWDFGLTDRQRRPKPALVAAACAFATAPFPERRPTPRISVVVCTHNGAATLDECLRGVAALDYADYETIVVDDGSTDRSAEIADLHGVRLIRTPNRGLSAARNEGLAAASGQIVAYLDDDASPDRHWLRFLALALEDAGLAAVGGPNLPIADDGEVAACVANAPGAPQHVLLADSVAEHIPGCNMAFRRERLEAIGGFDVRFRQAGDDVDICWRLQEHGHTIGFHPAAVVWHHRRRTVRGFWRQQRGYGHAEGLLERKWPDRYNGIGHMTWAGRLYGRGLTAGPLRSRIYYGVWGTAAFQQRSTHPAAGLLARAGAPEWYLVVVVLAAFAAASVLWRPLLVTVPLLALAVALSVGRAVEGGIRADFRGLVAGRPRTRRLRALTAALHVLQPLARLCGRLGVGLSPWRRARLEGGTTTAPVPREMSVWLDSWKPLEQRVGSLERSLRASGLRVRRADPYARWELQAATGTIGAGRVRIGVEEHGRGLQLLRVRVWPVIPRWAVTTVPALATLGVLAAFDGVWPVAATLAAAASSLAAAAVYESCRATASIGRAVAALGAPLVARSIVEPAATVSARLALAPEERAASSPATEPDHVAAGVGIGS